MSSIILFQVAVWTLLSSAASSYPTFYYYNYYDSPGFPSYNFGDNICKGETWSKTSVKLTNCNGHNEEHTYESAVIQSLDHKFFLSGGENPSLNITFSVLSPDQPQRYKIRVTEPSYPSTRPIFCGHIETPKPGSGGKRVVQHLGLEMRCSGAQLESGMTLTILIQPDGGQGKRKFVDVPGCYDRVIRGSKECKDLLKREILFTLRQDRKNSIVVHLTKSAYNSKKSKLEVQLSQLLDGYFGGMKRVGKSVFLAYPQRTTRFTNLTPGETYAAQVRRLDDNYYWSRKTIKIKQEYKKRRGIRRMGQRQN